MSRLTALYPVPSCSPLTKLLDTKPCLSLLYYSHLCSSSLDLQPQGSLLRVAFRPGNGYACCRLHHEFLARDLIYCHCVQTFNSLDQDPCVVAAYLQSTCSGGCQYYYLPRVYEPCRLVSFAAFTVPALPPGYEYSGPDVPDGTDLCECNTVVYSLLSACDACQGSDWFKYDSHWYPFSGSLGLCI
jgi:hypothetical protein